MKKCTRCRNLKDEKEFIDDKGQVVKMCRRCREYNKEYRERNKEYYKEYYERNKDRIKERKKEQDKERYERNKDRIKEQDKERYERNKDRIKEQCKEYRERNKAYYKEYNKEYRKSSAKYETYVHKLTVEESPVQGVDGGLLVKCAKCKTHYTPTRQEVRNRVRALEGKISGESRLYCSQECKDSCEIYGISHDPYTKHASVERDPAWAKRIKEEANYVCERCGSKENLEAHHEIPVKVDQSLVNDETNGICLCHECHMKAHSESGCTLADLRKI